MTRKTDPVVSVYGPIRIVPLHVDPGVLATTDAAAPAASPQLTYREGPLLTTVEVFRKTRTLGAYTVQLEWSNKHTTCR
jgi:hypothetical protein